MPAVFLRSRPYQGNALAMPVANVSDAIPFYENKMGFHVVSRQDSPIKSAILERDGIQICLAENGGNPADDGCFFEVDDIESAFEEVNGVKPTGAAISVQTFGPKSFRVFFVVAPDGLCYMLGQLISQ